MKSVARHIGEAKETLSQLKVELEEVAALHESLTGQVAAVETYIELVEGRADKLADSADRAESVPSHSQSMMDVAESDILRDGEYQHRNDVHAQLVERGFVIEGKHPIANVGSRLSADPRFESDGKGNWRLKPSLVEKESSPQVSIEGVVDSLRDVTRSASFQS